MKSQKELRIDVIMKMIDEKTIIGHSDVANELGISKSSAAHTLISLRKSCVLNHRTSEKYGRDGNKVTVYFREGVSEQAVEQAIEVRLDRRKRGRKASPEKRFFTGTPFLLDQIWRNIVSSASAGPQVG